LTALPAKIESLVGTPREGQPAEPDCKAIAMGKQNFVSDENAFIHRS
jgi:hypothetical protein